MLDLVIGRRELGKTTLAVSIADWYGTSVIFDPRHMIHTSDDVLTDSEVTGVLYEMLDTRQQVIVRPQFDINKTFAQMCEEIDNWLRENPEQKFCLLIDESRFVISPEKNFHFDFIVRCTPSKFVTVIMTAHTAIDISTHLRRIADFWLLFQTTMESDLQAIRERCGPDVEREVQTLKPFEFIVWNDGLRKWRKESNPKSWFVKLERVA